MASSCSPISGSPLSVPQQPRWLRHALSYERSIQWMIWMIVGRYVTIGFICMSMHAASMMLLPPDKARMGAGLMNIMQQGSGGTVGLAMMTTW